MTVIQSNAGVLDVAMEKVMGFTTARLTDALSIEEPLEIRLVADVAGRRTSQVIAVTMRTPGDDAELAAGFVFAEGLVANPVEIEDVFSERPNVIEVTLRRGVELDPEMIERHSFVASSCGVCGKKSIAAVWVRRKYAIAAGEPKLSLDVVHSLPQVLREAQSTFARTGGLHAAGLFDESGDLLLVREDVGRHNAVDKVIGAAIQSGMLPLSQHILLVSGRTSFELVQKAAQAGVPVLAAVGAPSSLAVQLSQECGMTLLGFVRNQRFNVYAGFERLALE